MPNDITVTKNTTSGSERFDIAYTVDQAGTKEKTLLTAGTLLDRNMKVSITTSAVSNLRLTGGNITSNLSLNYDDSKITLSNTDASNNGLYIQPNDSVTRAAITHSANISGYVSKVSGDTALNSATVSNTGSSYYLQGISLNVPQSGSSSFSIDKGGNKINISAFVNSTDTINDSLRAMINDVNLITTGDCAWRMSDSTHGKITVLDSSENQKSFITTYGNAESGVLNFVPYSSSVGDLYITAYDNNNQLITQGKKIIKNGKLNMNYCNGTSLSFTNFYFKVNNRYYCFTMQNIGSGSNALSCFYTNTSPGTFWDQIGEDFLNNEIIYFRLQRTYSTITSDFRFVLIPSLNIIMGIDVDSNSEHHINNGTWGANDFSYYNALHPSVFQQISDTESVLYYFKTTSINSTCIGSNN